MLGKLLALLAVLLVAGAIALAIVLPRRARSAAVHAWLVCGDCQEDELARVLRYGGKVVDPLRDALLDGPSPARRRAIAAQSAQAYVGRSPAQVGENVAHDVANYVALYQVRAIHALAALADSGIASAAAALTACWDSTQAGRRTYRPDVWRRLEVAATLAGAGPLGRGGSSDTAAFGQTVTVPRTAPPAWGPATALSLVGSPFADDLVVFRSPDTLRFLAIGWVGRQLVRIVPAPRATPEWRALSIGRMRYRMRTPADAETIALRDSAPRFAALRRGTDFHRVASGHGATTLADLDWSGAGSVWPEWRSCAQPDSLERWGSPSATRVLGRVLSAGTPLGRATVAVVGTALSAMTDSLGRFALTVPFTGPNAVALAVSAVGHETLRFRAHVGVGDGYEARLARTGRPDVAGVTLPSGPLVTCVFLAARVDSTPAGAEPVVARLRLRWP